METNSICCRLYPPARAPLLSARVSRLGRGGDRRPLPPSPQPPPCRSVVASLVGFCSCATVPCRALWRARCTQRCVVGARERPLRGPRGWAAGGGDSWCWLVGVGGLEQPRLVPMCLARPPFSLRASRRHGSQPGASAVTPVLSCSVHRARRLCLLWQAPLAGLERSCCFQRWMGSVDLASAGLPTR